MDLRPKVRSLRDFVWRNVSPARERAYPNVLVQVSGVSDFKCNGASSRMVVAPANKFGAAGLLLMVSRIPIHLDFRIRVLGAGLLLPLGVRIGRNGDRRARENRADKGLRRRESQRSRGPIPANRMGEPLLPRT